VVRRVGWLLYWWILSIDGDRNGHKQVEDRVGIADFWEFWLLALS
jgi:hypothetical protein